MEKTFEIFGVVTLVLGVMELIFLCILPLRKARKKMNQILYVYKQEDNIPVPLAESVFVSLKRPYIHGAIGVIIVAVGYTISVLL